MWASGSRTSALIPAKLEIMRQNIRRFILPPRRSEQGYPHEVRMTKAHPPIKKNAAQP
jgi:hypothetical protein